jgi:hypothetical protein
MLLRIQKEKVFRLKVFWGQVYLHSYQPVSKHISLSHPCPLPSRLPPPNKLHLSYVFSASLPKWMDYYARANLGVNKTCNTVCNFVITWKKKLHCTGQDLISALLQDFRIGLKDEKSKMFLAPSKFWGKVITSLATKTAWIYGFFLYVTVKEKKKEQFLKLHTYTHTQSRDLNSHFVFILDAVVVPFVFCDSNSNLPLTDFTSSLGSLQSMSYACSNTSILP